MSAEHNVALGLEQLTVIVVTFNSAHCIPALAGTLSRLPNVMVVDNASDDGTLDAVTQEMPNAKVIANPRNLGFGAANNLALNQTQTDYALLLNPDCIPEMDFFEKLLARTREFPEAAILAPQLIGRNGQEQVDYYWSPVQWGSKGPAAEGPCCVGHVCGAVMLFNMSLMRKVGFFDETFFLYYEDSDLCQRVFNHRYNMVVVPDVTIQHLSRGSVRGGSPLKGEYLRGYHHAQSKLIFERKHFKQGRLSRSRGVVLALAMLNFTVRLLFPQPRYLARLFGRIRGLMAYNQ